MNYKEQFIIEDNEMSIYGEVSFDNAETRLDIVQSITNRFHDIMVKNGNDSFAIKEFSGGLLENQIGNHYTMCPYRTFGYTVKLNIRSNEIITLIKLNITSKNAAYNMFHQLKQKIQHIFAEDKSIWSFSVDILVNGISVKSFANRR